MFMQLASPDNRRTGHADQVRDTISNALINHYPIESYEYYDDDDMILKSTFGNLIIEF